MDQLSKRFIEIRQQVGRQKRHAAVFLHLLEQVSDFNVRVLVVSVPNLGAHAERPSASSKRRIALKMGTHTIFP